MMGAATNDESTTSKELLASLLRLRMHEDSMGAAVAAWEREHGRTLPASTAFLEQAERAAIEMQETIDAADATVGDERAP